MTDQDQLYTVPEVAKYLKVSPRVVYRLIEAEELKAAKITPKLLRVTSSALKEFLNRDQ